jgi:hypothetical protein
VAKPLDLQRVPFKVFDARVTAINVALSKAASTLSQQRGETLSVREIERGLVDVLGLDEIYDLLYRDIDTADIVNLLRDYDFGGTSPQTLCKVEFDKSLLPSHFPIAPREAKAKIKGEVWFVHKCDAHPFPSNPHAHNYDRDLKMHLGTGDIYEGRKRVPCGRMKRQNLVQLRSQVILKNASIALPLLAV